MITMAVYILAVCNDLLDGWEAQSTSGATTRQGPHQWTTAWRQPDGGGGPADRDDGVLLAASTGSRRLSFWPRWVTGKKDCLRAASATTRQSRGAGGWRDCFTTATTGEEDGWGAWAAEGYGDSEGRGSHSGGQRPSGELRWQRISDLLKGCGGDILAVIKGNVC